MKYIPKHVLVVVSNTGNNLSSDMFPEATMEKVQAYFISKKKNTVDGWFEIDSNYQEEHAGYNLTFVRSMLDLVAASL